MANHSIRINKVLKELNISLDRVVDFLKEKGHEIEASPNTKINEEMYDILLNEFKSDKSKRIESSKISEEKEKEKNEILQEIEKTEQVIRAKAKSISRLKIVGKLEGIGKPEEKKEKEKAKEVVATQTTTIEKPLPKEEKKEEKEVSPQTIQEEIPLPDDSKTKLPVHKETEKKEEAPIIQKEEEDSGFIKTKLQKLAGPVLTGEKIDLKKFERPKKSVPPTKENKASSTSFSRRRKRIVTPTSNTKNFGNKKKRGDKVNNFNKKVELTDEEIQKQVRETLEKLQGKGSKFKGVKYRKEKRDTHRQRTEHDIAQQEKENKVLKVTEFVTLGEMAVLMDISINDVISSCMSLGMMVTMNQRLDAETLEIVADEFGFEIEFITTDIEETIEEEEDKKEDLSPRAPVVTIMGHVDHGKTSLLDYIRKTNVIAGEIGGITQSIKAYSVTLKNNQKITFMDTPGHQAFTAMRARGTQTTDVVVIVIAADDDIMPQTKEAISHAQAAAVPIIFAINKIDKPESNPEKIKESLANMNLLVEDWGGKIQSHEISAKQGSGVEELLEKILLEAELLDLKANPNKKANGVVVDAILDKGKGYVASLLVQNGTLKVGDYILAGQFSGKVKAMSDERDKPIKEAEPSTPVSVLGLDGAPLPGDKFSIFEDEKEAKQIADKRIQLQREQSVRSQKHITLDEIGRRIAIGGFKQLNIILKGDAGGSVEALSDSIQKLSTEEIHISIIHKAVGSITESDVQLASASDAVIIGFNAKPTDNASALANKEGIDIRTYSIIFDAINDVKDAVEGLLSPEIKEENSGKLEVRQLFKVSKLGIIAGCMVMNGKIQNTSLVRIIRNDEVIHTGTLSSLKRFKDDVKEVMKGYDCGIQVKNFNDFKENDIIEAYNEVKVRKKLK